MFLLLPSAVLADGAFEPLTIASRNGRHTFQVEVMRDDAGRAQGLMFRRSMAPDRGMLFDFERTEPVAMWMKNTYLPLDMLFIRADGTVARIAADTEPLDPHHLLRRAGARRARAQCRHRRAPRAAPRATRSSTRCSAGADTRRPAALRRRIPDQKPRFEMLGIDGW